jgi:hypothetical protein
MSQSRQTPRGLNANTLIAIALTVVCITGFSRLSFVATLVISLSALLGLLVFFWAVGRRKRLGQGLRADHSNDTAGGV